VRYVCLLFTVYYFILLARIIFSFVAQVWRPPSYALPAIDILFRLTEPVMAPVRRLIPPIGGLDFSPLLIFFALQLISRGLGC
jgi:YggT family protein